MKNLELTHNIASADPEDHKYTKTTDRSIAVYGYQQKVSKKQLYTIWMDESIPTNTIQTKTHDFTFTNGNFDNPVFVDIIKGGVYEIPGSQWSKNENTYTFKGIQVYDAPIIIADRSLIKL